MRSSAAAFKLVCELIGAKMANAWQLNTPPVAFVNIKPVHWRLPVTHCLSVPSWGCCKLEGVIDITPSTYKQIEPSKNLLAELLKIALFDFWIANEDRNMNNANLLYDVLQQKFVPIDYGCILNTSTFDYPISQLTITDTILSSDLFHVLHDNIHDNMLNGVCALESDYLDCIKRSKRKVSKIIEQIPEEWNVSVALIKRKLEELFDSFWIKSVWENFVECLNDNMR